MTSNNYQNVTECNQYCRMNHTCVQYRWIIITMQGMTSKPNTWWWEIITFSLAHILEPLKFNKRNLQSKLYPGVHVNKMIRHGKDESVEWIDDETIFDIHLKPMIGFTNGPFQGHQHLTYRVFVCFWEILSHKTFL